MRAGDGAVLMCYRPQVAECAIVGLPSEKWGQKAAAVVVLTEQGKTGGRGGKPWGPMDMRRALKERLVGYKIPQEMKVVESIPRNAMGKSKSPAHSVRLVRKIADRCSSQQENVGKRRVWRP